MDEQIDKEKAKERADEFEYGWKEMERAQQRGKIMGGLLVIAIGSVFLAKELGAQIPEWLISWKCLLIAIGLVIAIKHKFMHPVWMVMVLVGGAFLMNDLYPDMHLKPLLWPVLVIMLGLFILFKPRRKWSKKHRMRRYWENWHHYNHHHGHHGPHFHHRNYQQYPQDYCEPAKEEPTSDDYIDSIACFAGVKKNILSKKFKGGEITNILGGTELNLMQADVDEKCRLEITQVMGGTKLIIPAHWEIKSEVVTFLGSVEDKRPVNPAMAGEPGKVLILVGTTVLGGIEIRTY